MGEAVANAVKRQYRIHVWYDLQVMERAIPPLWQQGAGESGTEIDSLQTAGVG